MAGSLKEFQLITINLVNHTELEQVRDYMVRTYHYLGYHQMIGPRINSIYVTFFCLELFDKVSFRSATPLLAKIMGRQRRLA